MTNNTLSRRTMLRGLGVSMALPWMESMSVWGQDTLAKQQSPDAPTRMAILFAGCGFHRHEWWVKGTGSEMELGKVLHPLKDFRNQMTFIKGLYNAEALKGNIHSSQTGNLLSGAPLSAGGTFDPGQASTRSSPSKSVSRPNSQFLSSVAKKQTRLCTRITRCFTAHTFPGPVRRPRLPLKFIRPWHSTSCSRTKPNRVTKVYLMRCWPIHGIFVVVSAGWINRNWTSI